MSKDAAGIIIPGPLDNVKEQVDGREAKYCKEYTGESVVAPSSPKALDVQIGGGHYKNYAIQPTEYCQLNRLNWCESNVVKYITRWKDKGGLQDLKKVKHYVDLLIQIEGLEE